MVSCTTSPSNEQELAGHRKVLLSFMEDRAREIYNFLEDRLVKGDDIPISQKEKNTGGIVVVGWSFGGYVDDGPPRKCGVIPRQRCGARQVRPAHCFSWYPTLFTEIRHLHSLMAVFVQIQGTVSLDMTARGFLAHTTRSSTLPSMRRSFKLRSTTDSLATMRTGKSSHGARFKAASLSLSKPALTTARLTSEELSTMHRLRAAEPDGSEMLLIQGLVNTGLCAVFRRARCICQMALMRRKTRGAARR